MAEKVFYVTQEGLDALEKELNDLKVNGRREVADKIKVALSYGETVEKQESPKKPWYKRLFCGGEA